MYNVIILPVCVKMIPYNNKKKITIPLFNLSEY